MEIFRVSGFSCSVRKAARSFAHSIKSRPFFHGFSVRCQVFYSTGIFDTFGIVVDFDDVKACAGF